MEFDDRGFVVVETMNKEQAVAFIIFLETERLRHLKDITLIDERIKETKEKILDK
jgi:hypothetical protein